MHSNHCNSFEDQTPPHGIYGCLVFKHLTNCSGLTKIMGSGVLVHVMATRVSYAEGYATIYAYRNPDYTDRYDMNHKRRGLAVIINNVTFKRATQLGKRSGSDVDCALLKKDLESLGFDVEAHKDRTVEQMRGIFTSGMFCCFCRSIVVPGPLTRYVKLRVAHALGMLGTFSPPLFSKETPS